MARVHGSKASLTVDSKDLSTYIDNLEWSHEADMAETSAMGQTAKTHIKGMTDATFSITGKWDNTATTGPHAVLSALLTSEAAVTFEVGPEGTTAGDLVETGSCFCTSYNHTSPIGDVVAFAADFQCSGTVVYGTAS